MTDAAQTDKRAPPRGFLAPYRVIPDFLGADLVAELLAFARDHEAAFAPTGVGGGAGRVTDPQIRRSRGLRALGRFRPLLKARLRERAPALIAALRMSPFEVSRIELELVAHGDGAFYKRHIDTATSSGGEHMRVLSAVYYFHRQPKPFTGGALRLHAIGDDARFVDIEPLCDGLLIFPAWAPHEVMPVSVPSGRFADSRFAINCWLKQRRPQATP